MLDDKLNSAFISGGTCHSVVRFLDDTMSRVIFPNPCWGLREPSHNAAFFQIHNDEVNKNALKPGGEGAAPLYYSSLMAQLYTPEELRQPLRQVPPPRSGHLMVSCARRRSLILHGGLELGSEALLNDTWEYSLVTLRWIQLLCRGSANKNNFLHRRDFIGADQGLLGDDGMPPKAFGQCGTLFRNESCLFVHGGVKRRDDLSFPAFQLDIEKRLWTPLELTEPLPSMWGSVAQTVRVPVCGGGITNGLHSTWMRPYMPLSQQPKQKQQFVELVVVFGGMQGTEAYNDTYFLYLTTPPPSYCRLHYAETEPRVIEKLPSVPHTVFPGRRRACSTVCKDFFLFVFGGRDNAEFYNDMWVLNVCTQQWIMVREETPLRFMHDFFLRPFDSVPGRRIMNFVENVLRIRQAGEWLRESTYSPHRCMSRNSSARWRTGAVMVSRGVEVFILGGFTYDSRDILETHNDVHVYNFMRHTWRIVEMNEEAVLPPLPADYYETLVASLHGVLTEKATGHQKMIAPNGKKPARIKSVRLRPRTMAAMCPDPLRPGLRFFLFGGRSEDEPNGELYDVRIFTDNTDPCLFLGRENDPCADESVPGRLWELCRAVRPLQEQARDWVRATLEEELRLRRTRSLVASSGYSFVEERQLEEARVMRTALLAKVRERLPPGLLVAVEHTPPFVLGK